MIPGWIFAGSIPGPNQSYRAFPGLLFAEFLQETENTWQPVQPPSPEDPAIPTVSCRNHTSNIALFLLPETAIELVVDFNPYHPDLPVGLNRKRWTRSVAKDRMDHSFLLDKPESGQ
ncbi:MAG: hypothetical protein F4X24_00570 [Rhodobacteraceae bacterium]|nr:hypothetical protein [Paracoccaceae bacterium]